MEGVASYLPLRNLIGFFQFILVLETDKEHQLQLHTSFPLRCVNYH